ncbi:hypothetical protein FOZ60_016713 [Perkinsus olseni]|uniref:Phenazine biosynthesis-like domain-containing protein n=2 Tax=Perkinsus olseni TaxID=32597 RepID=A0A7J6P4V3_PEROL|nr:hypothetical protein FOZ60_016713 [Perkinsus olseni]
MSKDGDVSLPVFVADAFVTRSSSGAHFSGNPAGVVILPEGQSLRDEACQAVAAELRHSETAFLRPLDESNGKYALRWFTPTNEVPLCGHATLASARCLDELHVSAGKQLPDVYAFETSSGQLMVTRDRREGAEGQYVLSFPRNPPEDVWPPAGSPQWIKDILAALGLRLDQVAEVAVSHKAKKLLVVCHHREGKAVIEALQPDQGKLMASHGDDVIRGVSVMCWQAAGETPVVYSRYFGPWNGIPEDPVNGSSHTVIAPYMTTAGFLGPLRCIMLSARGGELVVEDGPDAVQIGGSCRVVISGSIRLPSHFFV